MMEAHVRAASTQSRFVTQDMDASIKVISL